MVLSFSKARSDTCSSSLTRHFLQFVMKKKELIPLITFVSFAGFGAVYMAIYSLHKSDVIVNRKRNPEPWENVNLYEPQKLLTINQKWEPVEELQTIKQLTK